MKRILSLLLALVMALPLCVAATAADTQSALETVRTRIGDTSDYTEFQSGSQSYGGQVLYTFRWSRSEPYQELYVTITDSGVITNYGLYVQSEGYDRKPTLSHPSQDAMLQAASDFVQKINPTAAQNIKITAENRVTLRSNQYYFTLQRMQSGYLVADDMGSLRIGADGKTVESFYINWTEGATFETADRVIAEADAQKAFTDAFGMRLSYERVWENETPAVRLVYRPVFNGSDYISAVTGEKITLRDAGATARYGKNGAVTTEEAASDSGFGGFTEIEQSELDTLAGLLKTEEEERLLRANAHLTLSGMKLAGHSRSKAWSGDQYTDSLRFSGDAASAYVQLDAKTGEILRYSYYDGSTAASRAALSDAALAEKAAAAAKALSGNRFAEYKEESAESGSLRYTRYINGVPFDEDAIYASVDPVSGKLTSYSIAYSDLQFPSPSGVLTAEQAAKAMFEAVKYLPQYRFTCTAEKAEAYDRAVLVYALENPYARVDAFTGEVGGREEASSELPAYTDISGHYGETAINALRAYGVGFDTAEYRPNAEITQGEFVTLLNSVFYGADGVIVYAQKDFAEACRIAVDNGVLHADEVDADKALTRETAAVWLIRALGMDEVASLSAIYKAPFADVSGAHVGHIAILTAMKVFNGAGNGKFLPEKKLTRADAAIVLYNYLIN